MLYYGTKRNVGHPGMLTILGIVTAVAAWGSGVVAVHTTDESGKTTKPAVLIASVSLIGLCAAILVIVGHARYGKIAGDLTYAMQRDAM